MMEAVQASEMLVNYYQSTQRYNLEDSHLHTHHHENFKSHLFYRNFKRLSAAGIISGKLNASSLSGCRKQRN
jgi:hypothetical protein